MIATRKYPKALPAPTVQIPVQAIAPKAQKKSSHEDAINAIIWRAITACNVDANDFFGVCRHPRVVAARRIVIVLVRELTCAPYSEIARRMRRPNHSTTISAHNDAVRIMGYPRGSAWREVPFGANKVEDFCDLLEKVRQEVSK